ncbi:MAG: methionine--tRNA ligase [Nanoarchaeota archaeon]
MKKKFYVTTAIDYVNAKPHIGHAYQKIIADILARWHRQRKEDVFFLTGTDEYGQKIAECAKEARKTPEKFVGEMSKEFKNAWDSLNLSYDKFIRTTDKEHEEKVIEFIKLVDKKGDIYKGKYSGLYCIGCEAYYTEKDLINGKCPFHPNKKIIQFTEEAYFFRLSKYQNQLLEFYDKTSDFIIPHSRRNEIINRVREGIRDLNITRTNFKWGIPFPLDKDHVTYVWFDALLNYITGIDWPNKKFKKFWPADVQLLGVDNSWFHCVIWPAMLFSAGIKPPKSILINGFLTVEGRKISKSLGNAISPLVLVKKYGSDSVRYFVARNFVFGQDGDFSEDALIRRHNGELADKLGNLVSRVSALAEKYGLEKFESKISLDGERKKLLREGKLERGTIEISDKEILHFLKRKKNKSLQVEPGEEFPLLLSYPQIFFEVTSSAVEEYLEKFELDKALNEIFAFIDFCNEYIQENKIWETKDKRMLYVLVEAIRKINFYLAPFMPETSEKIVKIFKGDKIKKAEPLFKKIDLNK